MSMKRVIFCEAPQKKVYRSYKNFDLGHFNIALKSEGYNDFETTFCIVLNKHAPIKVKILKHNNNPFLTQNLGKAIMHRSKFKIVSTNTALIKTGAIIKPNKITVSLLRKTKQ